MVSRAGIDIGIMIVGIMSITTGAMIAVGTTTGIATVATGTGMSTTRAKSEALSHCQIEHVTNLLAAAEPLTSSFWPPSPLDGSPSKGLSEEGRFEEFVEFLASRSASSTVIACNRHRS